MRYNFNIAKGSLTYGVPYNTKSIMQYDSYAFSKNGEPTMLKKVKEYDIYLLDLIIKKFKFCLIYINFIIRMEEKSQIQLFWQIPMYRD